MKKRATDILVQKEQKGSRKVREPTRHVKRPFLHTRHKPGQRPHRISFLQFHYLSNLFNITLNIIEITIAARAQSTLQYDAALRLRLASLGTSIQKYLGGPRGHLRNLHSSIYRAFTLTVSASLFSQAVYDQ